MSMRVDWLKHSLFPAPKGDLYFKMYPPGYKAKKSTHKAVASRIAHRRLTEWLTIIKILSASFRALIWLQISQRLVKELTVDRKKKGEKRRKITQGRK